METVIATTTPPETDLLCETCGYALTGLPAGGNCPECGHDTAESAIITRRLTLWEQKPGVLTYLATTGEILLHTRRFYRSLLTRKSRHESRRFALINWLIVAIIWGITGYVHISSFYYFDNSVFEGAIRRPIVGSLCVATMVIGVLCVATPLTSWLTSWEAGYRGLRLPWAVVARGLDYHTAHYIPVAIVSASTILGYRYLSQRYLGSTYDAIYLYTLCGEVILAAGFLFQTYWAGMRSMMYANA